MPIPNNEINADKDVFFTDRFKTLVRSEKELLKRTATTRPILEQNVMYAFRNDFYRVLRIYNVPSYLWWCTAFINGIEDPTQDISEMTSFLEISESILSAALARSNTVRG